jgi:hypothetical protein
MVRSCRQEGREWGGRLREWNVRMRVGCQAVKGAEAVRQGSSQGEADREGKGLQAVRAEDAHSDMGG